MNNVSGDIDAKKISPSSYTSYLHDHIQYQLTPQPPPPVKYIGVSDQLILEDQVQRVTLCGNISPSDFVTGVVIGVYGRELRNGCFEVEDYCFAEMPEQEENVIMETEEDAK